MRKHPFHRTMDRQKAIHRRFDRLTRAYLRRVEGAHPVRSMIRHAKSSRDFEEIELPMYPVWAANSLTNTLHGAYITRRWNYQRAFHPNEAYLCGWVDENGKWLMGDDDD